MNHEFIKYDVYLLWVLIYWFKLVKVCQARTAQGPIRCFKMLRFLEQGGQQSKKSVLLRHERAMQMPEHADCIVIFWLQSPACLSIP